MTRIVINLPVIDTYHHTEAANKEEALETLNYTKAKIQNALDDIEKQIVELEGR